MTGRHSVMLRPDSVRRVRPPKTTMPKTEAAEARSQYATEREEVSGHEEVFMGEVGCALEPILWLKAARGEEASWADPDCGRNCNRGCLNCFKKAVWRTDLKPLDVFACWCRHRLQTNASRKSKFAFAVSLDRNGEMNM